MGGINLINRHIAIVDAIYLILVPGAKQLVQELMKSHHFQLTIISTNISPFKGPTFAHTNCNAFKNT